MNGRICRALAIIALAGGAVIATGATAAAQIRTGMFGAANYNTVNAPLQDFIPGIGGGPLSPNDFFDASGIGAYAGVMGEYIIDDRLAMSLRVSYDQRNVEAQSNGSMLTARVAYTVIEPGVRVNLGNSPLHVMIGPLMAIKLSGTYNYASGAAEPAQDVTNGRLPNMRQVVFGGWTGFGYDFTLNRPGSSVAMYLTPFIEGSCLIDQIDPMDPENQGVVNTLTGRLGLQVAMQF